MYVSSATLYAVQTRRSMYLVIPQTSRNFLNCHLEEILTVSNLTGSQVQMIHYIHWLFLLQITSKYFQTKHVLYFRPSLLLTRQIILSRGIELRIEYFMSVFCNPDLAGTQENAYSSTDMRYADCIWGIINLRTIATFTSFLK